MGKKRNKQEKEKTKKFWSMLFIQEEIMAVLNTKYVLEWANKTVLHILIFVALTLQFNLKFFKCP